MKILSRENIQKADQYTIENEPITSIDLMERASEAFVQATVEKHFDFNKPVFVFAGKGNNGGDGLAISRMLSLMNFNVRVFIPQTSSKSGSDDFEKNLQRLEQVTPEFVTDASQLPEVPEGTVIIDALFGTGLNRPLEGLPAKIVQHINKYRERACILSVDIPSGLFCDEPNPDKTIVKAHYTYTFQVPKYSFFIPECGKYAGSFEVLDIGLSKEFLEKTPEKARYLTPEAVEKIPPREKFSHKGTYGHVLLCAGSYGKCGAAVLAASAAISSGAGLTTALIPQCGYSVMQTALPEAMVITGKNKNFLEELPVDPEKFDATGVGPGIDVNRQSYDFFSELLEKISDPLVIDADGLNLLSYYPELLKKVPEGSILTPHPGEFKRLAGKTENGFQQLYLASDFAVRYQVNLLLKGAYSAIINTSGEITFNSTGNPGMAKGGSGDVLTGIITALLARHRKPETALCQAVYLHGLAGDIACNEKGEEAMKAGDIINALPVGLNYLKK